MEAYTASILSAKEDDERIFVVVEDDHDNVFSTPPTKLKNPKLFRPFEMYIKMYGLLHGGIYRVNLVRKGHRHKINAPHIIIVTLTFIKNGV